MTENDLTATEAPVLDDVETWLFDLDNTLYPASCNLFEQIDRRMTVFIADLLGTDLGAARIVQKNYFRSYGTTMRGLMTEHGVDPEAFLDYVHDIDHSPVPRQPLLDSALEKLPGRKLIFTNASIAHAEKVLVRSGIARHFDDIFDIVAADFRPKPDPDSYHRLVGHHALEPRSTIFFDDIARNLQPASELGMTTVWVRTGSPWGAPGVGEYPAATYAIEDLAGWLDGVAAARQVRRGDGAAGDADDRG